MLLGSIITTRSKLVIDMNWYKKLISSQDTRLKILKVLNVIPDKIMLKLEYKIKTGNTLNLKNPRRYTEKLQWYKLNYHNPIMKECADKYSVRFYLEEHGYGETLNPLYAAYDSAAEIDFVSLPDSFAMKCSVGGGLNYFVQDKNKVDLNKLREMADRWLTCEYDLYGYAYGREWCYKDRKPKILFERLLPRNEKNDIPDYKFFCFEGKVFCLYTMIEYTDNHENGKLGFFDRNFNLLPYHRLDFAPITEQIQAPRCFSKMVSIAEDLAKEFPHVRVDFYDVNGNVVFGELTFYNASGFTKFEPDEFDFIMGEHFILPE